MSIYNLTEYSDNYSKTSGILWQYYRDEPFLNNNGAIAGFPPDNNKIFSYKFKTKIADRIGENCIKDVKIRVQLKYLGHIWRSLKVSSINCGTDLILIWSAKCFVIDGPIVGQEPTFTRTDTKLCVPVVALSTQYNPKLFEQLKAGFKRTINWNKYHSKVTVEQQN